MIRRIGLAVVVMSACVASAAPALGMEYCLDRNSKLYRFLGEASREMAGVHAPPAEGWERLTGALAEQVVKGVAESHFHVPACPTALERAVNALKEHPITQEDVDRLLAKP